MAWIVPWTKRRKLIALAEIDLTPIRRLMAEKEGWEAARALAAEREYKRFLSLIILHPGETVVPNEEIDAFWHMHILDTRRYMRDCLRVFGRMIHHDPHLAVGTPRQAEAWQRTQELYRKHYPAPAVVAQPEPAPPPEPARELASRRRFGLCFMLS